jgi:hypothetical protein
MEGTVMHAPLRIFANFFVGLVGLTLMSRVQGQTPTLAERFEAQVSAYEAEDKATPPPKNPILFVGDSQFFRWKTIREDLPGYTLINRGIDSFQLTDLIRYSDRLVTPYRPRLIVMHVGGNDVHHGHQSADQILVAFQSFVRKVRAVYPNVPIIFSSLTPGPGRWDEAAQRVEVNRVLREYIETQPDLKFVDLWTPMLTKDGKPREELWVEDRVHPNHEGYLVRVKYTRPLLGPPDKKK